MGRGRECEICSHPKCGQIDAALIQPGMAMAEVSRTFKVSYEAIRRHRRNHIGERLQWASKHFFAEAVEKSVKDIVGILERIVSTYEDKLDRGSLRDILTAIDLLCKLRGDYKAVAYPDIRWGAGLIDLKQAPPIPIPSGGKTSNGRQESETIEETEEETEEAEEPTEEEEIPTST